MPSARRSVEMPPIDFVIDVAVIRPQEEQLPDGYVMLERTVRGSSANLNKAGILSRAPKIHLCYKRGDGPHNHPYVVCDIHVINQGHEPVPHGYMPVTKTVGGRSADLNFGSGGQHLTLCILTRARHQVSVGWPSLFSSRHCRAAVRGVVCFGWAVEVGCRGNRDCMYLTSCGSLLSPCRRGPPCMKLRASARRRKSKCRTASPKQSPSTHAGDGERSLISVQISGPLSLSLLIARARRTLQQLPSDVLVSLAPHLAASPRGTAGTSTAGPLASRYILP